MSKLKYPEKVYASMTRIKDTEEGKYYLVRNNTRIEFGNPVDDKVIGSVIMTNPGSYKSDKVPGWDEFVNGHGDEDVFEGWGRADTTLQCIIESIRQAYNKVGKSIPDGYVNIYNLSSIVCPKSEVAEKTHDKVKSLINENVLNMNVLEEPIVTEKEKFIKLCEESNFIIIGLVQKKFKQKANEVLLWSEKYQHKIVTAPDKTEWPSHPFTWRTKKYLLEKAANKLSEII